MNQNHDELRMLDEGCPHHQDLPYGMMASLHFFKDTDPADPAADPAPNPLLGMITTAVSGKVVGIEFRHSSFRVRPIGGVEADFIRVRTTKCTIYELEDGVLKQIGVAVSVCKPPDNFAKAVGRKKSLTHCLRKMTEVGTIDKEGRAAIWESYWLSLNIARNAGRSNKGAIA